MPRSATTVARRAGDAQTYLRTYPGDDFVDVLGYDYYDDSGASPPKVPLGDQE
jgi:beta-mannanase